MNFEIVSEISEIEIIARGSGVHVRRYLNRRYGRGKWRKLKGIAWIRFSNGEVRLAELHWYEAEGIGRCEIKRKRFVER